MTQLTRYRRHLPVSIFTSYRRHLPVSIFTLYRRHLPVPIFLSTMSIPPSSNRSLFRFSRRCLFRFLSIEANSDPYDDVYSVFLQSKFIPILTTMSIPSSSNRSSFRFSRRCLFRFLSIEVHSDSYDDAHSVFFQSKFIPILKTKSIPFSFFTIDAIPIPIKVYFDFFFYRSPFRFLSTSKYNTDT